MTCHTGWHGILHSILSPVQGAPDSIIAASFCLRHCCLQHSKVQKKNSSSRGKKSHQSDSFWSTKHHPWQSQVYLGWSMQRTKMRLHWSGSVFQGRRGMRCAADAGNASTSGALGPGDNEEIVASVNVTR